MTTKRGTDQKLLPFAARAEFIAELDKALRKLKVTNRSQFIRDAIVEKLRLMGVKLPETLAAAPDRFGKGGPRPGKRTGERAGAVHGRRAVSSKLTSEDEDLLDKAGA